MAASELDKPGLKSLLVYEEKLSKQHKEHDKTLLRLLLAKLLRQIETVFHSGPVIREVSCTKGYILTSIVPAGVQPGQYILFALYCRDDLPHYPAGVFSDTWMRAVAGLNLADSNIQMIGCPVLLTSDGWIRVFAVGEHSSLESQYAGVARIFSVLEGCPGVDSDGSEILPAPVIRKFYHQPAVGTDPLELFRQLELMASGVPQDQRHKAIDICLRVLHILNHP